MNKVLKDISRIALKCRPGKSLFFASDFHFGVGNSAEREKKVVAWLEEKIPEADAFFLVGDIFDFWFEYRHAIPKGFVRFQAAIARITDTGIPVYFFTGNHDMWMFDYFPKELGVTVLTSPVLLETGTCTILVGHGDGLGPGDPGYKILKKVFQNPICKWLFARIHPNLGIGIANFWSKQSRLINNREEEKFKGEEREWILQWCKEQHPHIGAHYYVFGHRHLPLILPFDTATYINLGEWVNFSPYAQFDGNKMELLDYL